MIYQADWKSELQKGVHRSVLVLLIWPLFTALAVLSGGAEQLSGAGAVGVALCIVAFSFLRSEMQGQSVNMMWLSFGHLYGSMDGLAATQGSTAIASSVSKNSEQKLFSLSDSIEGIVEYSDVLQKLSANVLIVEVVLISLATLQWGYANQITCWLYGNGFTTC